MNTGFDGERFSALAAGLGLGRPLVLTELTDSTNDDALRAAREGVAHGALFVTEAQRRGRGRRGNTWHAAPGEALLFSVVLRPKVLAERVSILALVAGLAVRAAVAAPLSAAGVAARALVKWPNDVLVEQKKLAGILVESQMQATKLGAVVVGVGINVGRLNLPAGVLEHATSLATLGASVPREPLLASVLRELEARLLALEDGGIPLKSLIDELAAHDALRGQKVTVGALEGTAAGIDAVGNLELLDVSGRIHKLSSGHVTLNPAEITPKRN